MKKMGSRKSIVMFAGMAIFVLVICLSVFVRGSGREAYRSIRIVELNGTVLIEREKTGTLEAAVNMNLLSGDCVSTAEGAYAVLRLDTDKYVMLGECGAMEVTAEGDDTSGRTSIRLVSGSVLNEIQNPLGESSSYEIVTPNATMSVRGTVFEVRNHEEEDGKVSVLVYDGRVEVSPKGQEPAMYHEGEYTEFTGDQSPVYITERGIISSELMDEQMWQRLRQIEAEGRNVNYGTAGKDGGTALGTEAVHAQEPESQVVNSSASLPTLPLPAGMVAAERNGLIQDIMASGAGDVKEEGAQDEEEPGIVPLPKEEPVMAPEPGQEPSEEPSKEPELTQEPSEEPSEAPELSEDPSKEPELIPEPSEESSKEPELTPEPSEEPTGTPCPSPEPSKEPDLTPESSEEPSKEPELIPEPSEEPSKEPELTPKPSEEPTGTPCPSPEPSKEPDLTPEPSEEPSKEPDLTPEPSEEPSETPCPSPEPSKEPDLTPEPSEEPTGTPCPSPEPSEEPSETPCPSPEPSKEPDLTPEPSQEPTVPPAPEEGEYKTVTYYLPYIALNSEKDGSIYSEIKEQKAYNYGTEDVAVGTKLSTPGIPDVEATPLGYVAEKADFTFAGWCTEQEGEWNFDRNTVQEDTTLYPIWVDSKGQKYYPVIYESPEAEFVICNNIMIGAVGYEQPEKAELTKPEREGYVLSGWEKVSGEGSILVRFRAVWEKQGDS